MDFVLTTAGLQALINASETGTEAVQITHIGVGSGKYTPEKGQTALQALIKKIPIIEGGQAGDNAIHLAARDDSEDVYDAFEVGVFLADGTLFAVSSQQTAVISKPSLATALLAIDIAVVGADVSSVTFGAVSYSFTAATTERPGIVQMATADEVAAGVEEARAVSPAALASRLATEVLAGLVALASAEEASGGEDSTKALTASTLRSALMSAYKATTTMVDAGTDDEHFLTIVALKALQATTSRAGLIELATEDEVRAGVDSSRAVSPAALKAALEGLVDEGTVETKGIVRFATSDEASIGESDGVAMTPVSVKTVIDARAASVEEGKVGTEASKFMTPAALVGMKATTEAAVTGTDNTTWVTPAALKAAIDAAFEARMKTTLEENTHGID